MMIGFVLFALLSSSVDATPLDDYMKLPDPAYSWQLINSFRPSLFDVTIYNVFLTSQTWLHPNDSSIYTWQHWLQVCIPDRLRNTDIGALWIDGGPSVPLDPKKPPTEATAEGPVVPFLCQDTSAIVASLTEVPNEPAYFPSDWPPNQRRTEDGIIAFTWRHFINGSSPYWLLRMPMTKAAVKAMDATEEFLAQHYGGVSPVSKFLVAGASKRGWTTWTTMAVDPRVVAAVPIVMPIANMVPNLNHQYEIYGGWSFALDDYRNEGLMGYLNTPAWLKMCAIIDPLVYFPRYTMPKFVIAATGDEFFPTDSEQFFWNQLPGPKLLSVVPNAEHSLASGIIDVVTSIAAFAHLQMENLPLPSYDWNVVKSNGTAISGFPASTTVTIDAASLPYLKSVVMWKATTLSTTQRDFRLVKCLPVTKGGCFNAVFWWPTTLTASSPGVYVATSEPPSFGGWNGFNIEVIFEYPDSNVGRNKTLTTTTEVNVVPDVLPFSQCPASECQCLDNCPPPPPPAMFKR